jgi:hypothetical protein
MKKDSVEGSGLKTPEPLDQEIIEFLIGGKREHGMLGIHP